MRAVVFDLNLAKYAAAKALGRWIPSLYHGRLSCIRLGEWPTPKLPGSRWLRVRPLLAGVCGSDIALIFHKFSPALSPFNSFPCVPGHEMVGVVEETGSDVRNARVGDRIVIDPFFGCRVRDIDPVCASCAENEYALCTHADASKDSLLSPGMLMGFCSSLPGAWSDSVLCHDTQAFVIPDEIPDRRAAMIEPLSIAMRAILKRPPVTDERVLIIGGGMVGYAVLAGLRLLGLECQIVHLVWSPYQVEISQSLGADHTIAVRSAGDLYAALAEHCGARLLKPIIGKHTVAGGYDVVYDCIGSARSLDDALRFTAPGGRMVLLGGAAVVPKLDWTFVWSREVTVTGSYGYGYEGMASLPAGVDRNTLKPNEEGHPRTFEITRSLLSEPRVPVDNLVTHTFPLEEWRSAVIANLARDSHRSVKTLLEP